MEPNIVGVKIYFEHLSTPLEFKFFENSFVNKWKVHLGKALNKGAIIKNGGIFYGTSIFTKAELVEKLIAYVDFINKTGTECIELVPTMDLDQNFLNELHKEFERIGGQLSSLPMSAQSHVYDALVNLNTTIHQCEVYVKSTQGPVSNHFAFDVNFEIDERYNFEIDDYKYFTTDRFFGELYLNYATIGVPVLEAFKNKELKIPVPQRQYKADFSVAFSGENKSLYLEDLNRWVTEKYFWNYSDPTIAKGYIPLGQVVNLKYTQQQLFEKVRLNRRIQNVELVSSL